MDKPKKAMNPKSLKNLRPPFKKGQSGNPRGGQLHNPFRRALANLTIEEFAKVIELVMTTDIEGLERMAEDRTLSALQMGVARAFLKSVKDGDISTMNEISERVIGKVPDQVIHTASVNQTPPTKEQLAMLLQELKNEC